MFLLENHGAKFDSIRVRLARNVISDDTEPSDSEHGPVVVGGAGVEVLATQRIFAGQEIIRIPPQCVVTKTYVLHTDKMIAEIEALVSTLELRAHTKIVPNHSPMLSHPMALSCNSCLRVRLLPF